MTMWTSLFFSQLCKKWVLGRNGLGGSNGASTTSFSMLVNDTSTDFFQSSRGLR